MSPQKAKTSPEIPVALWKAVQETRETEWGSKATKKATPATRKLNARFDADVERLKAAYDAYKREHTKTAVYGYLNAAFEVGKHYKIKKQTTYVIERLHSTHGMRKHRRASMFRCIIKATSGASRRQKQHKWGRLLDAANALDLSFEELRRQVESAGGINNFLQQHRPATAPAQELTDDWEDDDGADWENETDDEDKDAYLGPGAPTTVQKALREAIKCYHAGASTATVLMCSIAMQRASAVHGIQSRSTSSCLEALASKGLIPQFICSVFRASFPEGEILPLSARLQQAGELLGLTSVALTTIFPPSGRK